MVKVTKKAGVPAPPAALSLTSVPTRRVSGRWISLFALSWFGVWIAQLTPVQLLLPLQVEEFLNATDWVQNVLGFGYISGIAGVFALVAYPLTGALSDRTTSRFGRRRPWMALGTAGFAGSLVILGLQTSLLGIGICWVAASTFFCVLTAALTAAISDQVPVNQRGYVSGWISAPQAIGIIAGLVLVTALGLGTFGGYALMAALLVVLGMPFLLLVPDGVLPPGIVPPLTLRSLLEGMWISPRAFPDFGWTLLSRILVNLGNAFGTSLLLYFLMYGLKVPDAEDSLILLTLVYMVFVIIASLWLGRLSDRLGRRRAFVFGASILQAIAALILAFVPTLTAATRCRSPVGAGLRLLPVSGPGTGHAGSPRPAFAREGPWHHEHRPDSSAGVRAHARSPAGQCRGRLHAAVPHLRADRLGRCRCRWPGQGRALAALRVRRRELLLRASRPPGPAAARDAAGPVSVAGPIVAVPADCRGRTARRVR